MREVCGQRQPEPYGKSASALHKCMSVTTEGVVTIINQYMLFLFFLLI